MKRRPRTPLWLLLLLALAACHREPPQRPNLVLVVLDTTRADHLSSYGYPRPTSPALDAFAAEAVLFEQAFAPSSWTLPSHASLFTGLLPVTHQASQEHQRLGDDFETLAELLSRSGYDTAAFSGNAWVGPRTNLVQGFQTVGEMWRSREPGRPERTNAAIRQWLETRDASRPFFLFVNYIEPHWTYTAPRRFQDRFVDPWIPDAERRRADFGVVAWYLHRHAIAPDLLPLRASLYDAEIAYTDAALGALLDTLRERHLLEKSLVVVLADHGENLGEHGHQGHSFALYDTTLRVPLLIRRPDGSQGGSRRSDPVQLPDVFVTLATAAGVKPDDPRVVGRDLLAGPAPADRPLLAEYYRPDQFLAYFPEAEREGPRLAPYRRRIRALRVGTHKLIWGSDGHDELFDLAADPGETRNLVAEQPELARQLEAELAGIVERYQGRAPDAPEPVKTDAETEQSLRELGYLR